MTQIMTEYDGRSAFTGAPPADPPRFRLATWSRQPAERRRRQPEAIRTWQAGRDAMRSIVTEHARELERFMLRMRFERELEECREPGWIEDAVSAKPETVPLALDVAQHCPLDDLGDPYCSFDPDTGDALLEWRLARRRVLILTINSRSELGYTALVGDKSYSGTEFFAGELPTEIIQILRALTAQP